MYHYVLMLNTAVVCRLHMFFIFIIASTNLNDLLNPGGADHVRVWVKANLIYNRAMTLQYHEGPVYHPTNTSCRDRKGMSIKVFWHLLQIYYMNTSNNIRDAWPEGVLITCLRVGGDSPHVKVKIIRARQDVLRTKKTYYCTTYTTQSMRGF